MSEDTKQARAFLPLAFARDWIPILVFLWAYRSTRDASVSLGRPIQWSPLLEADRLLFLGHVPTAWLQGHLLRSDGRVSWWELGIFVIYVSHFFAVLFLALVLWFRRYNRFRAFTTQLGVVILIGLTFYVLWPSAPPWAAGRCAADEVQSVVGYPPCMLQPEPADDSAVMLPTEGPGDGRGHVQRLTSRGIQPGLPGLDTAFYTASERENLVAALPSLHAAFSLLVAVHLYSGRRRFYRTLALTYPVAMGFTLVWTGDHYVVDILLGWLAVLAAMWMNSRGVALVLKRKGLKGLKLSKGDHERRCGPGALG